MKRIIVFIVAVFLFTVFLNSYQQVLAEDDGSSEQASEVQKQQLEQVREATKQSIEKSRETETVSSTGAKIKTKIEDDGTTKIEIEHGKFKLKYVSENGKVKLEAENEQGKTVGLDNSEIDTVKKEIEKELEDKGIEISTSSGKPVVMKNNFAATFDFPLSVNLDTKELIVTTPNGQKTVTILPDQAIANLFSSKIINQLNDSQTLLQQRGDELVYKVVGTKNHKLLGFIPVPTDATAYVSAQSGNVVATDQSLLTRIIDNLSTD